MTSPLRSAIQRLASINPFGTSSSEHEPPESYRDERLREVDIPLSEFDSPETFDRSPFLIHCGGCGGISESYWSWYNHLGDEFDALPAAQDWATVLVPDRYARSIEESVTEESGTPSIESEGKPSPNDPGET